MATTLGRDASGDDENARALARSTGSTFRRARASERGAVDALLTAVLRVALERRERALRSRASPAGATSADGDAAAAEASAKERVCYGLALFVLGVLALGSD